MLRLLGRVLYGITRPNTVGAPFLCVRFRFIFEKKSSDYVSTCTNGNLDNESKPRARNRRPYSMQLPILGLTLAQRNIFSSPTSISKSEEESKTVCDAILEVPNHTRPCYFK